MSESKTANGFDYSGPYNQIRLPDGKDVLSHDVAPQEKRLSTLSNPQVFRLCGYAMFCIGAFLVVAHYYKSSGLDSHLPPAPHLHTHWHPTSPGLKPEDLVYGDPVDTFSSSVGNCTLTEEWTFIDAGCGHEFERGKERFRTSASTNFTLPVHEEGDIQFFGMGNARMPGVAQIVLADDVGQKDVQVDVTAYMHDKEVFERIIKVCRSDPLAPMGERFHVQANFPRWTVKKPSHAMFMEMTVRLPRGATSSPLRMKNLGMVLGDFELVVDNLSDGVLFDTIQLMNQDAAIHIGSVTAGQAFVHSSEGAIRGSFNVSGDLTVATTNAPIDINATLTASPDSGGQKWPLFGIFSPASTTRASNELKLQTTNGAINANIIFSAEEHNLTDPDFDNKHYGAGLKTTNAPIDVVFSSLPGGRQLKAGVITQFANATVTLPPNFSGPVCVQSHGAPGAEPSIHDSVYGGQTAEERGVQFVNHHGEGGMLECADMEQMPSYARVISLCGGIDIHA